MIAYCDSVDAHLYDRVIIAAWLGHIAKVEDVGFFDVEFFHEVGHAKYFVHAWSNGVNRSGATNFIIELWSEFFAALDDGFAFFAIWVPGVFCFRAGGLAESREGDLAKAVFDNFVAFSKLVGFPITKFFGGSLDGFGNFCDLLVGQRVIVYLFPFFLFGVVAIILGALSYEKMKMFELLGFGVFKFVDDLNKELVEFLAGNWADFEMVKALRKKVGNFFWNRGFGDI